MAITKNFTSVNANGEGQIRATSDSSWADAKAQTSGTVTNTASTSTIQAKDSGSSPRWDISRAFFNFDTASIGNQADIESAVLRLYVTSKRDVNSVSAIIIQTSQDSTTTLASGDFDNVTLSNGGSLSYASITTGQYNEITLNSTGLDFITKGGVTKLGLVVSLDFNNVAPTNPSNNDIVWDTAEGTNVPQLQITYNANDGGAFIYNLMN